MKNLVHLTIAATLAIGAVANSHRHLHRHARKDIGSKAEKRAFDTTVLAAGPTETVYQLGDKIMPAEQAEAGLKKGDYVVVGESTPTYTPPPPPPPPKPTTTSVKNLGAQFLEKPSSSTNPPEPSTTSQPPPPKSTQAPKPTQPTKPSTPSGGTGLNAKFPSGQIKCSQFPSDYGAVAVNYLGLGGYTGVQSVPGFSMKSSLKIATINSGESCNPETMCSYACPPGYQKSQWSKAQGAKKESVGGLYCNSDGYLELTRDSNPTLCEPGAGGVSIKNDLDQVISTCRTDYPGTESMTIPNEAQPNELIPLTNPESSNYYVWDGQPTTAQYYVNKKGLAAKDACLWNCPNDPKGCGNWAPINIGVGMSSDGNTYISVFQNLPTSNAKLDFNIEIIGDVSSKCGYRNGNFIGGATGCTTAMKKGGKAVVRYY
ncbi:SUN domain-containing protein [Metarhizium rileyi]|uniref:SUN domain-containing protein n=1 Tax=Metarhizium rileyi (strain RCEF 4871) TaxID=1649241 RepID=A0A167B4S8_METRR|nr:SUN domain-containing protein [Metarhizium rileyi RCEF 4871]TWU75473.1 hypothetical protein ED733_005113 [Metarhizium rileyi]